MKVSNWNKQVFNCLDKAQTPLILLDDELNIIRYNASAQRALGIGEQSARRSLSEEWPELFEKIGNSGIRKSLNKGRTATVQASVNIGEMKSRYHVKVFSADAGLGLLLTEITDLSEEMKSLRARKADLENRLNDMQDTFYRADREGVLTNISSSVEKLLGFKPDEMKGKKVSDFYYIPEERQRFLQGIEEGGGVIEDFEARLRHKDGSGVWVSTNSHYYRDENGRIAGIEGIIRDISRRKEYQDLLNAALIENPIPTVVTDEQGKIVSINKACKDLLGFDTDGYSTLMEVARQVFSNNEHYMDKALSKIKKTLKGKNQGTTEYRLNRKDGSEKTVEVKKSLFSSGHIAQVIDITERKKYEADLIQKAEELNQLNCELVQFIDLASHELREPIRRISNFVQLANERLVAPDDAAMKTYMNYMREASKRISQLMCGLRDYSKIQTRKTNFVTTNCEDLIKDVERELKLHLESNQAVVTYDPLPYIKAIPSQIRHVFRELIENAVKFKNDEPPHIHISCEKIGKEQVFTIKDNGKGIDAKYFDYIFRIFKQLKRGGSNDGSGIGLALCRKIIYGHEGRIWLKSEPGKGSEFYFSLPV